MTRKNLNGDQRVGVLKCRICPGRKGIEGGSRVCRDCKMLVCENHSRVENGRATCSICNGDPLPGTIRFQGVAITRVNKKGFDSTGNWVVFDPRLLEGSRRPSSQPWSTWVGIAEEILAAEKVRIERGLAEPDL